MMPRKVMVSATIFSYGVTKPFFVNENGIKVNEENYCKHQKKQLFSTIKNLLSVIVNSAPSHRPNLVLDFLEKTLKRRFVKYVE